MHVKLQPESMQLMALYFNCEKFHFGKITGAQGEWNTYIQEIEEIWRYRKKRSKW